MLPMKNAQRSFHRAGRGVTDSKIAPPSKFPAELHFMMSERRRLARSGRQPWRTRVRTVPLTKKDRDSSSETSSRDDLYSADLRERMPSTFRAALHIARQQHFAKKHREAKDSKTDAMLRERQRRRAMMAGRDVHLMSLVDDQSSRVATTEKISRWAKNFPPWMLRRESAFSSCFMPANSLATSQ